MTISNSETIHSVFYRMHNIFKNRAAFSILIWLHENEIGLNVEDIIAGFNLSRASAFRYCRMLADADVVDRVWDVAEKDIRTYARNRYVINKYGRKLIDTLFSLEKTTKPIEVTEVETQEWNLRTEVSAELDRRIAGRLADHVHTKRFEDLIFKLISKEYAEIKDRTIHILWSREGANAVIVWSQNKTDSIRCNITVTEWPEPAIIGLLSHELSHIALGTDLHDELQADEDVIERGLGHYLAIERAFTNKYSNYILRDGEDMYLGYNSIRKRLNSREVELLDKMISDQGIKIV